MAIQANELRIGNWVRKSGSNTPYMVTLERFWEHYNTADAFYYLEPIPLTSEILEKSGFTHIDRKVNFGISGYFPDKTWFIPDGEIKLRNGTYPVYKHGFCIGSYSRKDSFYYSNHRHETIGVEVKHLHYLQNLYRFVTGEELSIDLK